jgi:putative flippase GtrA
VTRFLLEQLARFATLLRSGAVGIAATLVDLATLTLLVELVGLPPAWANVPGLVAGVAVQFFGNKLFAFRDRSRAYLRQGTLFLLVEVGSFALNALAFHGLAVLLSVPYLLARLLATAAVYFGFSYPLWRRIFTPGRAERRRQPPRPSPPRSDRPREGHGGAAGASVVCLSAQGARAERRRQPPWPSPPRSDTGGER